MPGHHDDRDRGKAGLGPQSPADGESVHSRHIHVEKYDRDLSREGGLESRAAVVEAERLETTLGG